MSSEQRALKKQQIIEILRNEEIKNKISNLDNPTIEDIYNLIKNLIPEGKCLSEKKAKKVIKEFLNKDLFSKSNERVIKNEEKIDNIENQDNVTQQSAIEPLNNNSEEITSVKQAIKDSVLLIDNVKIKEYENMPIMRAHFENNMQNINKSLNDINKKLLDFMSNHSQTPINFKKEPLNNIQLINQLISSNDNITIQVNKILLSKAAKYFDMNSILKFEDIIKEGNDINTLIVQYILILFIAQNSLF